MILLLRVLLVLVWIPAQYVGVLLGALGSLAAQSRESDSGSVLVGVIGLVAPAVLAIGGLWLSWQRPEMGAKVLVIPIVLMLVELALLLVWAAMAGQR